MFFFFYRESAYELMNGQLVLFQWADCAVKNLGVEYFLGVRVLLLKRLSMFSRNVVILVN